MTVRRRALLAITSGLLIGWLFFDIGWRLAASLLFELRGSDGSGVACGGSGLSRLLGLFNGCNSLDYRYGYAAVELVIGIALAGGLCYGLARWTARSLDQLTRAVEQLGPTNLGLRLRLHGPARDETRRLGDALDRMLDQVAAGYDAQRRFASNASHELRTPLATQRALIEISLTDSLTPEQVALLSRQLLSTNERNERLIDGLLTLAESEQGLLTTGRVPLDEAARAAVDALAPTATERDVTLHVIAGPVVVLGEQALLERLLSNLIQNAVKYNHPGGRVEVRVDAPGSVTVANTGPNVPPDQVAALFEPFRRLSGDRLDHGGGVGLGLTIARSIVAAHDGTIGARANPDGGLTLTIQLAPAGYG